MRVDLDALEITEATGDEHGLAWEGFVSMYPGRMHARGHDGHTVIGLGIARAFEAITDFDGALRLFFEPAEEGSRGGRAMTRSGHLSDVDFLLALLLGFGRDTGTLVAEFDQSLANGRFDVTFDGSLAHAGTLHNEGTIRCRPR